MSTSQETIFINPPVFTGEVKSTFKYDIIYPFPQDITDLNSILQDYFHNSLYGRQRLSARQYYNGQQDILSYKPTLKDITGNHIDSLAENNLIVDNQVNRMTDQKTAYLASNTMIVSPPKNEDSDSPTEQAKNQIDTLLTTLDDYLQKDIRSICREAILFGTSYYDYGRKVVLNTENAIPLKGTYADPQAEGVIYLEPHIFTTNNISYLYYDITVYSIPDAYNNYVSDSISYYTTPLPLPQNQDISPFNRNISISNIQLGLFPTQSPKGTLLRFKSTISVYAEIKGLQDALNRLHSTLLNNIFEDRRSTIFVLENYTNQDLDDFRHNLATYGVIPVHTIEGVKGDARILKIEVNTQNFQICIDTIKKAIIRNARGYDIEDLKAGVTPNQMTIKAIFNNISQDSDDIESLFEDSFKHLISLILDQPIDNKTLPTLSFNRSNVVIESQQILDVMNLKGLLSQQSLIERIPSVNDPQRELTLLEEERQREQERINQSAQSQANRSQPSQAQVYNQTASLLH